MHLNIKSDEAHRMASELAALTGESVARAVTEAVRERLNRVRAKPDERAERLLAIGRDCAARLDQATLVVEHGDLLYDEAGLPR